MGRGEQQDFVCAYAQQVLCAQLRYVQHGSHELGGREERQSSRGGKSVVLDETGYLPQGIQRRQTVHAGVRRAAVCGRGGHVARRLQG